MNPNREAATLFALVAAGALVWGVLQFVRADDPVRRLEGDLFLLMGLVAASTAAILAAMGRRPR